MTTTDIPSSRLRALRAEAAEHGDDSLVQLIDIARGHLEGDAAQALATIHDILASTPTE